MKMNSAETALMNNPVRAAIQRYYEGPLLRRLGGDAEGLRALEIGCGRGVGTEIIHHIPDWRAAVAEVHRVLVPGGRFYFEEVTLHALARWSYRTLLDHPTDDRFGQFGFVSELEQQGLRVGDNAVKRFFGDFVIGAAARQ